MRKALLILASLAAVSVVAAWVATGSATGWSKTQVETRKLDPVTEIEYPVWEDKLVLGVDFLAAGLGGSILLAGAAFFIPSGKNKTTDLKEKH